MRESNDGTAVALVRKVAVQQASVGDGGFAVDGQPLRFGVVVDLDVEVSPVWSPPDMISGGPSLLASLCSCDVVFLLIWCCLVVDWLLFGC